MTIVHDHVCLVYSCWLLWCINVNSENFIRRMCLINNKTAHHQGRQGSHCSSVHNEYFIPFFLSQKLDVGFLELLFLTAISSGLTENKLHCCGRVVARQFNVRGICWADMSTVKAAIFHECIVVFLRSSKQRPVGSRTASHHIRPNSLFRNTWRFWRGGNWDTDRVFKQTESGALGDNRRLREWRTFDTTMGMRVMCLVLYRRVCVCVCVCGVCVCVREIGLIVCVCVCVCMYVVYVFVWERSDW